MLNACLRRVCGAKRVRRKAPFKLGYDETCVGVDIVADGHERDTTVVDAQRVEVWARQDRWLELG